MIVVLIFVGSPPDGILGGIVNYNKLVLGRAAGVYAGHDVDSAQLAELALFIALKAGLGLFLKEHLIGRIVDYFRSAGNAVLGKIDVCHFLLHNLSVLFMQELAGDYSLRAKSKLPHDIFMISHGHVKINTNCQEILK